jgi:hypothetical protein
MRTKRSLNITIDVLERLLSDMFDEDAKRSMILSELRRLNEEYKIVENNT